MFIIFLYVGLTAGPDTVFLSMSYVSLLIHPLIIRHIFKVCFLLFSAIVVFIWTNRHRSELSNNRRDQNETVTPNLEVQI